MKAVIPEVSEADEYGQHAAAFMRKVLKMGYAKALDDEIANPSWDDQHWCRMIVGLKADRAK